jgi:acyl-CoA thioester hydrolase
MAKVFTTTVEVRGYELDSFNHVYHGNYLQYLDHARWGMIQEAGIDWYTFNEWKVWPVVYNIEVQYLKPAFFGQKLEIRSRVLEHARTNFTFEQIIYFRGDPIVKAKVRVAMINEKGRPVAAPEKLAEAWKVDG